MENLGFNCGAETKVTLIKISLKSGPNIKSYFIDVEIIIQLKMTYYNPD